MNYALFPPHNIWAEFSNLTIRPASSREAFHSKLNFMFYTNHPNISLLGVFYKL